MKELKDLMKHYPSVNQLSVALGVNRSTVSRLVRGIGKPSHDTYQKIIQLTKKHEQ